MRVIATIVGNGCTHNTYDNGIQEFVFLAPTREAVDSWVDFNIKLYDTIGATRKLPILFDSTQTGQLPLGYIINRVRVLLAHRPAGLYTLTALLVVSNPVNDLARALTNNILRTQQLRDEVKFFAAQQREAAIMWLLKP